MINGKSQSVFMFVASIVFALIFASPLRSARTAAQKRAGATLVCVISRMDSPETDFNMDAVVLVENGKFRLPYAEENETSQQVFGKQYFAAGKKYRVTFGGGEIGNATVKNFGTGCNNIHAVASVTNASKLPADGLALATDSETLGNSAAARRAPTIAERRSVMAVVRQIYRQHGTSPGLINTIKTIKLTATDLDHDGSFEMIGSFIVETTQKARRDLFLIAEPANRHSGATGTFKAALVKFQAYKLPPEGFDSSIDFVDQLDLDGDGVGEVFVQQHGYDAYGYLIFKKSRGQWRQVFAGPGDAC